MGIRVTVKSSNVDAGLTLTQLAERAAKLDAHNALAYTRERFLIPPNLVYLDGNSLGVLPAAVPAAVEDAMHRQWGNGLISSWFEEGWWEAPLRDFKRETEWLHAASDRLLEYLALPALHVAAAAVNFAMVLVMSRPVFHLPFKHLDEIPESRSILTSLHLQPRKQTSG